MLPFGINELPHFQAEDPLKMLKRQMFGRANIDLLKLRVLYRM